MPHPVRANPVLANWHYLYTHPAKAEVALEPHIAKLGWVYRYQHIVWRYILDFALFVGGCRIAVEIDGPDHDKKAKREKDAERTEFLEKNGWRVLRFKNKEVFADPHAVAAKIQSEVMLTVAQCAMDKHDKALQRLAVT